MRKFMILLFVVVATMNMYAQIAVSDRGHVDRTFRYKVKNCKPIKADNNNEIP